MGVDLGGTDVIDGSGLAVDFDFDAVELKGQAVSVEVGPFPETGGAGEIPTEDGEPGAGRDAGFKRGGLHEGFCARTTGKSAEESV